MSILLSDEELDKHYSTTWQEFDIEDVLKAAAIHAVQFMEGKCTEHKVAGRALQDEVYFTVVGFYYKHHFLCPECREKYHKELGISLTGEGK
jgi:hypothetical protein